MFENLFHRICPDAFVVRLTQIGEQTMDLRRRQCQLGENRHLIVVEKVFDQRTELFVRTRIADENEDFVANQLVARQTFRLENGKKSLEKSLVDHCLILQAEMNQLKIVIERTILISQEHRYLMAVVDRRIRTARGFHR